MFKKLWNDIESILRSFNDEISMDAIDFYPSQIIV
jgi:hypothetical protein